MDDTGSLFLVVMVVVISSSCSTVEIIAEVPSDDCCVEDSSSWTFFETFFFSFRVLDRGDTADGAIGESSVVVLTDSVTMDVVEEELGLWPSVSVVSGRAVVVVDRRIFLRGTGTAVGVDEGMVNSGTEVDDDSVADCDEYEVEGRCVTGTEGE